jgi:adenine-specific DNA-methyltransferase
MIYIDPPYGIKYGSNFQPFVNKREVKDGKDDDLNQEPEMIKAFRDTWEVGIHSYLTYLRDRLFLSRELLNESGSVFVQINDENVHHIREIMDEIFGASNFISLIAFVKTTSSTSVSLSGVYDILVWYGKNKSRLKYHQLFLEKIRGSSGATGYTRVLLKDGNIVAASEFENEEGELNLPEDATLIALDNITSQSPGSRYDVIFKGKKY